MELSMGKIHTNRMIGELRREISLSGDFNVPDTKADVLEVVKEYGKVNLTRISFEGDMFKVEGGLEFRLLYVGEEEGRPLCDMTGEIGIMKELVVHLEDEVDRQRVEWQVFVSQVKVQAYVINSRKINVTATIFLELQGDESTECEAAMDISGDSDVQVKKRTCEMNQLVCVKKETFSLHEQWTLPQGKPAIAKVLFSRVLPMELEFRPLENQLAMRGQGVCSILYMGEDSEGTQSFHEESFSLNGTISCAEAKEDMISGTKAMVESESIRIAEDEDGENRMLHMDVTLGIYVRLYEKQKRELLEDFYWTKGNLNPVYKQKQYHNIYMKNAASSMVSGIVSYENKPELLQLWMQDGQVGLREVKKEENGVMVDGILAYDILYVSGDEKSPASCLKGEIPFSQLVEIEKCDKELSYQIGLNLSKITATPLGEGEVEVKATVTVSVLAYYLDTLEVIDSYQQEEILKELREQEPGMVGYVVGKEECLWDIAKKYHKTTEDLIELNDLENDELSEGQMLLIV